MNRELFEQAIKEDGPLSLEDAKARAILYHEFIVLSNDPQAVDMWFQVSDNWDINIWKPATDGPVCATLYPCEKGEDGLFHTNTLIDGTEVISENPNDFPVPEQELADFLEQFGNKEFYSVCTGRLSGEFCYAEYDYSDEENIMFKLIWGLNDGDENWKAQEDFRISIEDFKNAKTFQEKYDLCQS